MVEAGYHVVVNIEATGAHSDRIAEYAIDRMQAAGVQVMNFFSINAELTRDWNAKHPDASQIIPFLDK